jgi:hypothetical protein
LCYEIIPPHRWIHERRRHSPHRPPTDEAIAAAAGVAILGKSLAWSTPVGAVVVPAGAALTQSRARR